MTKILTGFQIVNDRNGKRIAYAYDEVNEAGELISSNNHKSYIALDEETKLKILNLEKLIEEKMNLDI